MALRAWKTCQRAGCPALIREGTRCEKHRKSEMRERNEQEHRLIYKTARWKRLRMMKLRDASFCELADLCVQRTGHPAVATVVDHIKSTAEFPELAYDWDNLRSCCKPCHDARTARDQGFAKG